MKKKLSKILGVSLALVLAFTLVGGFMPANTPEAQAQGVTPNQWNIAAIPSIIGNVLLPASEVADFAVGPDAGLDTGTIWAIDNTPVTWGVYQSTDGGNTFGMVGLPAGFVNPPKLIAVAPDDPTVAVVVESVTENVWLTKTDGATWTNIQHAGMWAGTEIIYAIDVGPARSDAFIGRDIVVATADTVFNTFGDIYWTGTAATWERIATVGAPGVSAADYTSVKFAPNWLGIRDIVTVASDLATPGTFLRTFRIQGEAPLAVATVCNIPIQTGMSVMPTEVDAALPGTSIFTSTLDLPADADFSGAGTSTAYVGWNSEYAGAAVVSDDVYRIDRASLLGSATVRKLGIGASVGIQSISFSGTVMEGGTCFAAESAYPLGAMIWHCEDANVAMPSWMYCPKWPTGTFATKVIASPDFSESKVVFAGTVGDAPGTGRSAFSRSTNGGVSYNQLALIDAVAPITLLNDVMPTPDNTTVFLSTNDANAASLWRSKVPTTSASWERILTRGPAPYIIRVSPDYLEDSTLYWCAFGGQDIRKSPNKGEVFVGRTAPVAIWDFAVESKDVVYMADAGGTNVRKSTNGATRFELPVGANAGVIWSLAMAPTYPEKPVEGNLLVGGAGNDVSISTDGAASFTRLLPFYPTGANMNVLAHKDYADNNYVYAGSNTPGDGILRYKVGESAEWEQIVLGYGAAHRITGLAMHCGNLYGAWHDLVNSGAWRSVHGYPLAPMPLTSFDNMNVGAAVGAIFNAPPSTLRAGGNDTEVGLWAIDTVANALLSYNDTMAKLVVDVTVPAKVPYDPNTRLNSQFTISWNQLSNGVSYNVEIYRDTGRADLAYAVPGGNIPPICPNWYVPASPPTPSVVIAAGTPGLAPGNVYYVFIRARNQSTGDMIRSRWSAANKLVFEAGVPIEVPYPSPQLLGPLPGATGTSVTPGFAWGAFHGAVNYEYELSTDPGVTARGYFVDALVGLTGDNALVTTAWQCDVDLDYNTNYYWHVKAVLAEGETPWSTGVFTTMSEAEIPAPPPPPVELPAPITPAWIWAIVAIGAILVIVVIVLIFVTRKP